MAISEERLEWRNYILNSERAKLQRILESSAHFSSEEVDIALELIDDFLAKDETSDYKFLAALLDSELIGYSCFGRIPCTKNGFDLYWIAVTNSLRGHGIGHLILKRTEEEVLHLGGSQIYADTSGRPQYEPTRGFYRSCGYELAAEFPDFYAPGDAKMVYRKILNRKSYS